MTHSQDSDLEVQHLPLGVAACGFGPRELAPQVVSQSPPASESQGLRRRRQPCGLGLTAMHSGGQRYIDPSLLWGTAELSLT